MNNTRDRKLQDQYLNYLRKERIPVTVFLINGARIKGTIRGFDNFVVLLKQSTQQLVYKHAISTIAPEKDVPLPDGRDTRSETESTDAVPSS